MRIWIFGLIPLVTAVQSWASVEDGPKDTAIVVGGDHVRAVNQEGKSEWELEIPHPAYKPIGKPVRAGELVLIPASKTLHALEAKSGKERWRFAVPVAADGSWAEITNFPAVADTTVVINRGWELVGIDLRTGRETWSLPGDSGYSPPTIVAGKILTVLESSGGGYSLKVLNPRKGKVLHSTDISAAGHRIEAKTDKPAVVTKRGAVFCTRGLVFLASADGKILWQTPLKDGPMFGCQAAADSMRVFVALDYDDKVLAFDLESGQKVWEQKVSGLSADAAYHY